MWSEDNPLLPYDGWYGGNVKLMIGNGTYLDFRPKLLSLANNGFYSSIGTKEERVAKSMEKIAAWDKEWEAIPDDTKEILRNRVADDTEIREKIVHTARGPMKVYVARPACNNNLDLSEQRKKKELKKRHGSGPITRENSPIKKKKLVSSHS